MVEILDEHWRETEDGVRYWYAWKAAKDRPCGRCPWLVENHGIVDEQPLEQEGAFLPSTRRDLWFRGQRQDGGGIGCAGTEFYSGAAVAAHARGLLEDDRVALDAAIDAFDGGPRVLAFAAALEDRADIMVRHAEKEPAIDDLSRALSLYADAGASWDAGRVRGRLREIGIRRRLSASARPTRGWVGLTDSELLVVRLVGEGLTNRETAAKLYLSPHTVSMHLRHAFSKLGINSRVELARVVVEHDREAD
jgi:DNA-binding CsgD family transcriptional regulator